ncbi:hypothetical protein PQ469_05950 [Mucilaginibacter sp. KACC 22773]|uniref:hypothetical protein n=1 Tax=Mucilaginibacter sp. KACC 22773 TaxID=3025671 RepID=UPI002367256F|nr:hypothetical protein [Mucilaginibacter sp. KACC 22773]WDF79545.1 hypothetical protein PQ469_05950 [Mucilaginibacter sp. KACC 22773]
MADSEDFQKRILLEVTAKTDTLKQDAANLNIELDKLKAGLKAVEVENTKGSKAYVEHASKIRLTAEELRKTNKEIDNATKALKAESGSMDQNKALVATLTAEYSKLKQTEGETSQATKQMEADLKKVNETLKDQKEKIGSTSRLFKDLESNLKNALSSLGGAVPGLQGVGGAMGQVVKIGGFLGPVLKVTESAFGGVAKSITNLVGNSGRTQVGGFFEGTAAAAKTATVATEETAVAVEGVGAAAGEATPAIGGLAGVVSGVAIAFVAVAAVAIGVAAWFAKLTPNAESLKRGFAGVGGAFTAFMSDIGKGVGFSELFSDMGKAYTEAKNLTQGLQDLARAADVLAVSNTRVDAEIQLLQLKLRNKSNTAEQEASYFKQIEDKLQKKYQVNKDYADKEYDLAVKQAVNGRKFSEQEIELLRKNGIEQAVILDKKYGLHGGDDALKAIIKAQNDQIQAQAFRDQKEQVAQNKKDAFDARQERKQQAAVDKAQRLKEQADHDKAEAKRAYDEALSERQASAARMLQFQANSFANELSANDEHYRQLIFKERTFIAKQEELRNKSKSPEAKANFNKAIGIAHGNIKELQDERGLSKLQLIEDNNKKTADLIEKSNNELKALEIANNKDTLSRQIAEINQHHEAQLDANQKEREDLAINISRLKAARDAAHGQEKKDLSKHLSDLENLEDLAGKKALQINKAAADAIKKAKQDAANAEIKAIDQAAVIDTGKGGEHENAKKHRDALLAQEDDEFSIAINQEGLTEAAKFLIYTSHLAKRKAITQAYNKEIMGEAIQVEQLLQNAAEKIISNSIQHSLQSKLSALDKQHTSELRNTSLTVTQKQVIEDKYQKKVQQAKIKAFKQEQEMAIIKAIINTAIGVTEAIPNPFYMAFALASGIAETAIIASQKPPAAYATGGLYRSDNKGAILNGPGTGTSDSINARLSHGEAVINAKSTAMYAPLLSALNEAGGGRAFAKSSNGQSAFATGGVFSNNMYLPTADNGLRPAGISIHNNVDLSGIEGTLNNLPGHISNAMSGVSLAVDVKDINHAQGLISKVEDRSIH